MLFPNIKIHLASQSPRRKNLLEQAGIKFQIISKDVAEIIPEGMPIKEVPQYLAKVKGDASSDCLTANNEVIISADTIVCLDNQIFGKPKDSKDAADILSQLSGKQHQVITGVCLTSLQQQITFAEVADVYFNELTIKQIYHYIEKFEPYDKAGAYAIQEWISLVGIRKIDGCYYNIMGLPVSRLIQELNKFSKNIV